MGFVKGLRGAAAAVAACAFVAGCGDVLSTLDRSRSSSNNKTTLTNVNPDGTTGPLVGSVSGVAMDGRLVGSEVRIFSFSEGRKGELLASGITDTDGRYRVDLKVISQPLLIEASGGRYIEPASEVSVDLADTDVMLAVQNYRSGNKLSVSLTYLTTLAAGLAENMMRMGATAPSAVEGANQRIAAIAGLAAGFDALTARPVNISDAASVTPFVTSELEYGFVGAALSSLTEAASATANRPIHEGINSIALTQLALDDVRRDGVLDGQGTQGALAIGVTPLKTDIYRNVLALNVLRMAADTQGNRTSISPAQLLPLAQRLNGSADPIYDGQPVIPLNVDAPVVADLSIGPNALLAGSTTLTASIMSLIGVTRVEALVDNVVVGTAPDATNPSIIIIDTTMIPDGSHQFSVRATDLIGGETNVPAFAITVSNTQGSIGNISLINGSIVRGLVNVTADIVDSAGIAQVRYFVDNFQPVITTDPKMPFKLDTVALALDDARPHVLRITAINNLGREITGPTTNFNVDNQAPTVAISSPSTGAFLRQQFTLVASSTDNGPLGQLELSIDNQRPEITRVPEGFLINTLNFPQGTRALAVRSVDQAGNDTVATLSVTFDNTAPTAAITNPARNTAIRGAFDVVATLSDNLALDLTATIVLDPTLDGGGTGTDSAVMQTSISQGTVRQPIEGTSIPPDGPHAYAVIARDRAGNSVTSSMVSVTIDNTPPVITIDDVRASDGRCFFSGTISDMSQISEASFASQGLTTPLALGAQTVGSFAVEPTGPFVITATDAAGNISTFDTLGAEPESFGGLDASLGNISCVLRVVR